MAEAAAGSSHLDHTQEIRECSHDFRNLKSHPLTHFLQQGQPPITSTPIATYWGSVFKCTQLLGVTSFKPYLCTRNRIFSCGTFHVEYHDSLQQSSKHCGFGVFKLEIPNLYFQYNLNWHIFLSFFLSEKPN